MSAAPIANQETPLALICGGGSLPLAVADSVSARGRKVVLFPLRGAADAAGFSRYPHHWLYLGQANKFFRQRARRRLPRRRVYRIAGAPVALAISASISRR